METPATYVICTSPRSGSTLLCGLLAATGIAGAPQSYFHRPSVEAWCRELDVPEEGHASPRARLAAVVAAARRKGSAGTPIFGLRLQRPSFPFLIQQLDLLHPGLDSDLARFTAAFGPCRFLHLTRADKLDQAVSCIRAEQSGEWHRAPDGSWIERAASTEALHYDGERIARQIADFERYERDWEDWFRAERITPLRLTYDALSTDPRGELRRVLADLGLDPDAAEGIQPGVAKLADATSRDWIARYRSERAAG